MSDIDWSEAPEWAISYGFVGEDDRDVFYNDDRYQYASGNQSNQAFKFEAGFDRCEFTLVEVKPPKPVYTQAMSNHDILPLVGMECCYSSLSMVVWNECTVIAYYDGFVWTSDNGIRPLADTKFKPITPPIELIDGKAYQFNIEKGLFLGFYQESRSSFFYEKVNGNKICGKSEATNIQLLEVK